MYLKRYKVTGIKWDCDEEDPKEYNLPTDTVIECEDEDYVVDALSDKYGWFIYSVKDIKEIKNGK